MGYETALHLIDVKIKDESVSIVRKVLRLLADLHHNS